MSDNKDRSECKYHTALLYSKVVRIASKKADQETKELLLRYGSFEAIFKEKKKGMEVEEFLNKKVIDRIDNAPFHFRTITVLDSDFPEQLRKVDKSTGVIYTVGDVSLLNKKSVAVVGSRKLEEFKDFEPEKELYPTLEKKLEKGCVIVSGLARGSDTLGHEHAIEKGGKTIAVMGTSLDKYSCSQNKKLQEEIGKNHLLVSQFPIGCDCYPGYFAYRNNTTVGITTDGIIVVRAKDRSGTLHAIKACVDQGKNLGVLAKNLRKGYKWEKGYKKYISVIN